MKKSKNRVWQKVPDNKVQLIWKCPECGEMAIVPPTFFAESGTPICTGFLDLGKQCEGTDMEYVCTEIWSDNENNY